MREIDKLLEQFSHAELNAAWANRENETEEVVFEKGGNLDEATAGYESRVSFYQLSPKRIQFWIDQGPHTADNFQN